MFRAKTLILAASFIVALVSVVPACSSKHDTPACSNGVKDDGEEGVDCGGTCSAKCTGETCAMDTDCASDHCNPDSTCAAPVSKTCGVGAPIATCNDGQPCELDRDCASGFCDGSTCAEPAAGSHTDGIKNGGETGIDCGGSVKATQPCPDGQGCVDSTDCVGTCTAGVCGPIGPMDGKKDNGETDIDCGGTLAPKCADGKACVANSDCAEDYCPDATMLCTAPTYTDGVQNGTETDVDCGGAGMGMLKCAEGKKCLVDTDCNAACNYKNLCVDVPSCKPQYGGDTCGGGEDGNGDSPTHMTAAGPAAGHESCCRALPVTGYSDSSNPGKTVYLDKYEITSGRMRAFLEAIGGGVDGVGNAKDANIKAWVQAHTPARWNSEWSDVLPQANAGVNFTYNIVDSAATDPLYFGQTIYARYPKPGTQPWTVQSGPQTIDTGVFSALGAPHFYPEMIGGGMVYPGIPTPDYGASHALDCANGDGSYGLSTYWFDKATVAVYGYGANGKFYAKNDLDEKALSCSPFALMAAFCAWDGGQLATAEVVDYITENTISPVYGAYSPTSPAVDGTKPGMNGKYTSGAASGVGNCTGGVLSYSDGATPCTDSPGKYPSDDDANSYDGANRIASPGRIAVDVMTKNAGDEPWMDMIGNLHEAVLAAGETQRFDYRGYGHEYTSILYHRAQFTTPRGKGGSIGGRCMRFK